MIRLLHERSLFSERFMAHLFNSSEKRLARVLLLLDGSAPRGRGSAGS